MKLLLQLLMLALFVNVSWALTLEGVPYVSLAGAVDKLGMTGRLSADGKTEVFKGIFESLEVTLNQKSSTVNGTRVWLNYPIAEEKNAFYISQLDYERVLLPLFRPRSFALTKYHLRKIVIDPGHGGKDTGARNPQLKTNEKTFTLDVARRLKEHLEALGYKVVLTRNSDRYIELKDRSAEANALHADLFISIHFNAAAPTVMGAETYACTPQGAPSSSSAEPEDTDSQGQPANRHDIASLTFAYDVQRSIVESLKTTDRGIKHARFVVLEGLNCPGILVEGGFITSSTEGPRLMSPAYREQLASAIVRGIRSYHRQIIGMR